MKNNIYTNCLNFWKRRGKILTRIFIVAIVIYSPFFFCVDWTEPTEIGIVRNFVTGEMYLQDTGGWHLKSPLTFLSIIDTRPVRVSVTSGGRGYSSKLVQFDPTYWREFVQTEGFRYYWWSNRISINMGYNEEYRGMKDILRGYAYSNRKYPFIKILKEYQQDGN